RFAGKVSSVADGGAGAGGAARLQPEGKLEAHHPKLLRVPALSDCASAAAKALALYERRQRAAPGHLPGRANGLARRREDVDHERWQRPELPARPERCRSTPYLLLLRPSQLSSEPPSRLYADLHLVAACS